jgi:hypothetical protein
MIHDAHLSTIVREVQSRVPGAKQVPTGVRRGASHA